MLALMLLVETLAVSLLSGLLIYFKSMSSNADEDDNGKIDCATEKQIDQPNIIFILLDDVVSSRY